MRQLLVGLMAIVAVFLSAISGVNAHEYREVKEGRWKQVGTSQCEGYNLHLYRDHVKQNKENQVEEYRFSQFGHKVVVSGLKYRRPRVAVTGEVSEEYIHFEMSESSDTVSLLQVWVVEILEDEEELEYIYWTTVVYADPVWTECSGYRYAGTCFGNEFVAGVPNYPEGYKRYSVKCAGTLEWQGW